MTMREVRSWIFLGLGLVLAGLTGLALYGVAQEYGNRQTIIASETAEVVVAAVDVDARSVLSVEMLAKRTYPIALVPAGALANEAEAIGQTTLAAIPKGGPVVQSQLASAGGRRGASITLAKGQVLVSFPTTDPLTTAGLLHAGDVVDILATVATGPGESSRKTQTMVQGLEVIDILAPKDGQRMHSLTFVVDHQVALVLKYLRDAQATVDIAVRSRAEKESTATRSVDLGYLVQTYGIDR
jgi:Flp pilus assembly protein CpaB